MVWFQCEDCGDNLKKPKLANHFRQCSAFKLSCIDCGQVFGQRDVESHTQCITEAEKYGPKGPGKALNGSNIKSKNDAKPKPEVDINVGLSERPPWFCSLCNTKATSQQTLLLHADGKKHRAKARAFHASKQQPNDAAETKSSTEKDAKNEVPENKDSGESGDQNSSKPAPQLDGSAVENNSLKSKKKRKHEASENGGAQHKTGGDISAELGNGEVTQFTGEETGKGSKKAKDSLIQENVELDPSADEDIPKKKIKWKKLITEALKYCDGPVRFKKLKKHVMKSLKKSGHTDDENQVSGMIELKINSSSRFLVTEGKYVRLANFS